MTNAETAALREQAQRNEAELDWFAGLPTFKAVLLEGLEVDFIVIALSAATVKTPQAKLIQIQSSRKGPDLAAHRARYQLPIAKDAQ